MDLNWTFKSKVMVVWLGKGLSFSISRDSIYYGPQPDIQVKSYGSQSDIRVKIYGGLDFPEAFLLNFGCLNKLKNSIEHQSKKLWLFKFARGFTFQFWMPQCIIGLNQTSNFERLDILWALIGHPRQKLSPFEFGKGILVQFWGSRYIMGLNQTSESKVMVVWSCPGLPCRISSVSIYYWRQLDILVKSYGH